MGHSGVDGRGLEGVELAFERQLRGHGSSVVGVRDALGRELFVDGMGDAAASGVGVGGDVVLTIDRYLTFVTERAIAEAQVRHRAKAVTAVMLDPGSGDVLAMASVPSHNPNEPGGAAEGGARNRAITDAFEPGSTMKTFTIAAALDAGVVRPDDKVDCMMGRMPVGKYIVHDTHPHGVLSVAEVFKMSSNIGTAKIARRLGRDRLAEALARFGFGRPVGIGLPGERSGVVRAVGKWGDIGFANVAFGQGLTATPLQIVSGVAAIAAGGAYRPPRIVSRIVHADGRAEPVAARPTRQVLSEAAARQMVSIMKGVTEPGGTARAAAIDGYAVAGKTGTAQKVSGGRYDPDKWVASFVGFAPADAPRVAIVVLVDEPQGVHLGGAVAAPVWREIAEQALRYLHVPPSPELLAAKQAKDAKQVKEAGKVQAKEAARRRAPGADPAEERPGSDVAALAVDEDEGDGAERGDRGNHSIAQDTRAEGGVADRSERGDRGDPSERSERRPPETATERASIVVPDFAGMSVAAVIRTARDAGVELALDEGGPVTGVARGQRPGPGPAPRGTRCQVSFGRPE
jgi:cell division protein FtsI (penicillin-binding protein 3)